MAVAWISLFFRGPVVDVWEFGKLGMPPRYARDQTRVNAVTGLAILATGRIIGLIIMFRVLAARAFSVGGIVGTTLLGIMFASW